ncbi:MAG: adenosylcobinamide-GDP ribazoletransferase [Synergistaceae bacterium]|jgi:adenosylcobinamide-GDP ribazoletransferase|nr:adenosylcobinamide-GDP ribazoletransferase [Synergistaceae bacterium]
MAEKTLNARKISEYFVRLEAEAKEPAFQEGVWRSFVSVWLLVTRIPLPASLVASRRLPAARDIAALPAAGAAFGFIAALPAWFLTFAAPAAASAWIACGLYVLLGWSLHLDGWGDLWDGFGSGRRGDAMLAVMKDSRVGSFGVAGIVLAIAIRAALLADIDPMLWLFAAATAGGIARFALAVTAFWGKYPWPGGMGLDIVRNFDGYDLFLAFIVTCLLFPIAPLVWIIGIPLVSLASFGLALWANKNLGGTNGDVLGASAVLGELLVLIVFAALPRG